MYYKQGHQCQAAADERRTTIMAFFELCRGGDDFAKTLLYNEVPKHYTWDKSGRMWKRRQRGRVLVRVYTVHPRQQECFFVRMLLHQVRGPTSFEALRTFEGQLYNTFRDACHARGLLESDAHWDSALQEASRSNMPSHI